EVEQTFAETAELEVVGGRALHGFARQEMPEFLGSESLIGASADAVSIHDDESRLFVRVERDDRFADVGQLDLHPDDSEEVENVPSVGVLGQAEFGANRVVAASLRR